MSTQDSIKQTMEVLESEAEKRRQDAAKKAQIPLPKCIKSIERTEVMYTIDPDFLPYSQAEPQKLISLLRERYGLTMYFKYDTTALAQFGLDPSKMTEDRIAKLILGSMKTTPGAALAFVEGRYATGPNSFVPVNTVVFTSESISVNVTGVTEIAEAIVADAFELLWQASGGIKKWESKEIQNALQMKSHGTCTKVDIGCDPRKIIAPTLIELFDKNINSGKKYGAGMMSFSGYDAFKPSSQSISVWTFDEMYIQVHVFNQVTGRQETARIRFNVATKDERGRGIIELTTELPFDLHAELAADIVSALNG